MNINQNVAILIDGNNLQRGVGELFQRLDSRTNLPDNVILNYDNFIPRVVGERTLVKMIYFREGRVISPRFTKRIQDKFYGKTVPCYKSADIPLAISAVKLADKVDTIIIFSGDSDYIELVRYLSSNGVRVEVACVKHALSIHLRKEVDQIHYIDLDDCLDLNELKELRHTS